MAAGPQTPAAQRGARTAPTRPQGQDFHPDFRNVRSLLRFASASLECNVQQFINALRHLPAYPLGLRQVLK
eukprot:4476137-Pyramimonas_sp.AAC.1